jgi:hypothetical protein
LSGIFSKPRVDPRIGAEGAGRGEKDAGAMNNDGAGGSLSFHGDTLRSATLREREAENPQSSSSLKVTGGTLGHLNK